MKIEEVHITTPDEDPIFFDVDWRHLIICCNIPVAQNRLPKEVRNDKYIKNGIRYFFKEYRTQAYRRFDKMRRLYMGSQSRFILEALLLTSASFSEIAKIVTLDPKDIELLSALYFDVRDGQGQLRPLMKARFDSMPQPDDASPHSRQWRTAALNGGLPALLQLFKKPEQSAGDPLENIVVAELTRRVLEGGMPTRELTTVMHALNERQRLSVELGAENPQVKEAYGFVMDILSLWKPKMAPLVQDEAQLKAQQEALDKKLGAERNIHATKVPDIGVAAASAEMNKRIQQNLASQASNIPRPVQRAQIIP